ncbi:MAG: tRNA (adenosine(37)-N6)-threonylcarbamoyltransferase complex dimerization subunit type 1 TsaB [Alphaproteobacteria bacterium]
MQILALDCATQACSVALLVDGRPAAHGYEERARGHAERLLPMAREILDQAGTDYAAIDAFAVTIGPGTYTGVRIALATARALALAAGCPLIGITTMAAVARAAMVSPTPPVDGDILVVALETKRADFYIQYFQADLTPLSAPASLPPEDVAATLPTGRLVVAGDGGARLAEVLGPSRPLVLLPGADYPDAQHVAILAADQLAARSVTATQPPPRALYLRPPDVTMPRPRPSFSK